MHNTKEQVTVSLSTTPVRINNIIPTLTNLLSQTRPPDRIIVAVPFFCNRLNQHLTEIPEILSDLEKTTQVKILITEDYGPATKFLAAWRTIESRENHFLIWLDDDINYNNTLVEELVNSCAEGTAVATAGFNLKHINGEPCHAVQSQHLREVDIIEGFGGVCCRLTDIPDLSKLWKIKPYDKMSYIEKCYWHSDDYVMSRALQDNGIKTKVCFTGKHNRRMIEPWEHGLQSDALQKSTETGGHKKAYAALEHIRTFNNLVTLLKK
jgi:hypothetical protein